MVTAGTFAVSAFWHGFYPFYYFMFAMCALFVETAKDIYRMRIFFDFIPAPYGHLLANIGQFLVLNYLGVSFNALTFERGNNFGKATYYYIFILLPVLCFSIKALGLVKMAKKMEEKQNAQKEAKESKKDK